MSFTHQEGMSDNDRSRISSYFWDGVRKGGLNNNARNTPHISFNDVSMVMVGTSSPLRLSKLSRRF